MVTLFPLRLTLFSVCFLLALAFTRVSSGRESFAKMQDLENLLNEKNFTQVTLEQIERMGSKFMISHQENILKLMDFKLENFADDQPETDYSIVLMIIAKAFKYYLNDFDAYQVWLDKLLELIESERIQKIEDIRTKENKGENLNDPRIYSLIAVFSMLNYLQRY